MAMVWAPVLPTLHFSPQDPHPSRLGPAFSRAGLTRAPRLRMRRGNLVWAELECSGGRLPGEPQGQRVGGGRKASDAGPIMDAWQPAGRRREAKPATERTERRPRTGRGRREGGPGVPGAAGPSDLAPAVGKSRGYTAPPRSAPLRSSPCTRGPVRYTPPALKPTPARDPLALASPPAKAAALPLCGPSK